MNKLHTINAEDLQNRTYAPTPFLVDELIPEGLHILAGAPKIGKSWLALWLCLCVSQGQPLWGFATTQGEVLYKESGTCGNFPERLFGLAPCGWIPGLPQAAGEYPGGWVLGTRTAKI